jgi:hypothetical protein
MTTKKRDYSVGKHAMTAAAQHLDVILRRIELTHDELLGRKPLSRAGQHESGFVVGGNYYIRTVVYHSIGRVVKATPAAVWLAPCAYIRDCQPWFEALQKGNISDLSYWPPEVWPVEIRQAVIQDDAFWPFDLPQLG